MKAGWNEYCDNCNYQWPLDLDEGHKCEDFPLPDDSFAFPSHARTCTKCKIGKVYQDDKGVYHFCEVCK